MTSKIFSVFVLWTLAVSLATVTCDTKQYFLELKNTGNNLKIQEFDLLINATAKLGDPCDSIFDNNIARIHKANSTNAYLQAIRQLVKKIRDLDINSKIAEVNSSDTETTIPSPTRSAAKRSCFGFIAEGSLYRPTIMTCVEGTCECANEEPLVYKEDPDDPTGCHVVYKKLGESCTYKEIKLATGSVQKAKGRSTITRHEGRSEFFYVDAYKKAAEALAKNPTVSQGAEIMKNFAQDTVHQYAADLIPQDIRNTCYDDDNLMECKPNGKCGCRNLEPYFQYVESDGACVGKSKSLCYLEALAKDQQTKFIFADGACADGKPCERAMDSMSVKWPVIKACGGSWGLKDDVNGFSGQEVSGGRRLNNLMLTFGILIAIFFKLAIHYAS